MKKITTKVYCDSCGREISKDAPTLSWSEYPFYEGGVSLHIRKWGGGFIL